MPTTTDRLVAGGAFYVVRGNGQLARVGRGGVAPQDPPRVVFPDLLIEVQPDRSILDAEYLAHVWQTDGVRAQIEAVARTSSGIHKVNLRGLAAIAIPVPSLARQRSMVAGLAVDLATLGAMRGAVETQREAAEALPGALLRRAFAEIEAA